MRCSTFAAIVHFPAFSAEQPYSLARCALSLPSMEPLDCVLHVVSRPCIWQVHRAVPPLVSGRHHRLSAFRGLWHCEWRLWPIQGGQVLHRIQPHGRDHARGEERMRGQVRLQCERQLQRVGRPVLGGQLEAFDNLGGVLEWWPSGALARCSHDSAECLALFRAALCLSMFASTVTYTATHRTITHTHTHTHTTSPSPSPLPKLTCILSQPTASNLHPTAAPAHSIAH
jgi:hypothetical protein